MGGLCGSFGSFEDLESLVTLVKEGGERELFVRDPGVALVGKEGTYLGNGFFYGVLYSDEQLDILREGAVEDAAKALSALAATADGEYVAAAFEEGKLCLSRDYYGKYPLFIKKEPAFCFSTSLGGFEDAPPKHQMEDGSTILVKRGRVTKTYRRPKLSFGKHRIDFYESLPRIRAELDAALERRAAHAATFSIMFSGGIDSALLAKLSLSHADVCLLTIGADLAEDCAFAVQMEEEMGASLSLIELDEDVVADIARDVIQAIGPSCSVLDFELALPAYLASKHAKTRLIFSGQGADELFGGYHRYQEAYKESPAAFEKMQLEDLRRIGRTNLQRDQLAAHANGCHITTPYLTPGMASVVLSTETLARINVTKNKIVLRKLAEREGLPMEICERKKKAMQYGSGLHALLKQMAKEQGFTAEKAKEAGNIGPLDMLLSSFKEPLER